MTKLQRFIPQTPDPYLRQADQLGAVRFGHLNALVDAINATVYGDYLQLAGNGPMSTTLRPLEDPDGNIANLYLATDKTAISGSLKIGDTAANLPSAILEISSTTKGVLLPKMTTVQRDAIVSPAVGLIIYNTDEVTLNQWDGTEWSEIGGGGGLGLLNDALMTSTLTEVVDKENTESALLLSTNRIGISADPTVTTQSTAVIQSSTTNGGIAIVPNGTGAITASIPDGTATGGAARGQYAVDLQMSRNSDSQVAARDYSVIVGGERNTVGGVSSAKFSSILGGSTNTVLGSFDGILGGNQNTTNSSGSYNAIGGGFFNRILTPASYANILGGNSNTVSTNYSTISGGQSNTASTGAHATVVGGHLNLSSGQYSVSGGYSSEATGQSAIGIGRHAHARNDWAVAFGNNNTVNNLASSILGGDTNNISSNYSTISGGQSNTVTTGTHATVVGGLSNTSSGTSSVTGGYLNNASGQVATSFGQQNTVSGNHAFAVGFQNQATSTGAVALNLLNRATKQSTLAIGTLANAYLLNGFSQASGNFSGGPQVSEIQQTTIIANRQANLSAAATTVLSLDGTGTTNLIIPNDSNRSWNVNIKYVAVVTAISGTATGVSVGDTKTQTIDLGFKRVGGTSSIVGSAGYSATNEDASMSSAMLIPTAGASQELALTFTAPSFAGGGTLTMRIVAKVSLTEVAW